MGARENHVYNISVSNCSSYGINVGGYNNISIEKSKFRNNGIGINWVNTNKNSIIRDNSFSYNSHGIDISSGNGGSVYNNSFTGTSGTSIYLNSNQNLSLFENKFNNNPGTGIGGYASNSNSNLKIFNNTFTLTHIAISFVSNSQIYENFISDCENYGLFLGDGNNVYKNTIKDCLNGIYSDSGNNWNVSDNVIRGCRDTGLYGYMLQNSIITRNIIENNENSGFKLYGWSNNQIYDNILNNTLNVDLDPLSYTSLWNVTKTTGPNIINGPYIGGNYWANPSGTGYSQTCTDSNNDGFCDNAYTVGSGNVDNLPLHKGTSSYTIHATAGTGGTISPSGDVTVPEGGSQTFSITPNGDYQISSVLVDGSSVGAVSSYTFTNVTADHIITASFSSSVTHNITASSGPGGSISPSGTVVVPEGGNQTFSITPNGGYQISSVLVDGSSVGKESTYTFTNVTADHTITASFSSSVTHNITASSGTGGSISPSGTVVVPEGGNQTFSITPNDGYQISSVLVDGSSVSKESTYTFTNVTADHTITASFSSSLTHNITATAGPGGSISPSGTILVPDGGNQTFAISPNTSYQIDNVLVDGSSVGKVSMYTFTNVTADHTITASFSSSVTHNIAASSGPGGSISPSGTVVVPEGGNQSFTISPNTSYQIDNVLVDGSSVGKVSMYTFTNVTADHTITVSFSSSVTHNITASSGPGGSISPSGTILVPDGGNQTFAINPDSGYLIQDILVDGSSVGALSTYTFTNVTGDHRIYASFSQVTPLNYTIIASAGSGGRIIPNGSVQVAAGANQTFNISNNLGMVIDTVMVDNVSQGAIRSYTFYNVSANHTISASFKVLYPTTWYINATAGTGGSIDPSGLVRVFNGYNKTFLITALSCYDITDVIINNTVKLGPQVSPFQYNFTSVTSNQSIEALFTQKIYIINATAGIGGKISPKGEISVPCGGDQTFAISPDTNYEVISVLVDGLDKGAIRSYTFSNVTVNHEISAYFTRIPGIYEINASADQYTIVYPNGIKKFQEGSNKTYITQSKPGSDLTGIKVDSTTFLPNVSWTFTNISSDHNISTMGEYTPGQVQVFFSANQTWGQAPLTVQFIDHSVGNPTSWYWQFGDGKTSTSQNPVNVYEIPGTYTVTLRASSSVSGGVGIYTDMIKVTNGVVPQPTPFPTPVKITADFTAVPQKGSAPLDVSFQDQSSGNPVSWIWYFGDGQVSTLQNPTHRYSSAGSYSVTLLAQNVKYSGSISKPGFITAF